MPCSNGKKQKTGHYSNNAHYRRQPNSMFTPGTDVIEKNTSHKYTVLQKYEKAPRSLIRVENKNDGTIRYIRSDLLHTENYSKQIVNNNRSKVMADKPQRKKRQFVKNTDIIEFKKNKREFNELLKPYNSVTKCGGGVSVDYSKDSKGKFYIHRLSGNKMIDEFNEKNLEVMNYHYDRINNRAKMTVTDHSISRERILDIYMLDNSGSTNNFVPDCSSKSDYYDIVNRYINSK